VGDGSDAQPAENCLIGSEAHAGGLSISLNCAIFHRVLVLLSLFFGTPLSDSLESDFRKFDSGTSFAVCCESFHSIIAHVLHSIIANVSDLCLARPSVQPSFLVSAICSVHRMPCRVLMFCFSQYLEPGFATCIFIFYMEYRAGC
jgi:hypothetical protein